MKKKRNLKSDPLKPFPASNPLSRQVHKARLIAQKVADELNRKHPEPMSLMHKREKNGEINFATPKGTATQGQVEKAADAMSAWDNSDPFSYGRTALHVRQGFLNSDEVVKEMTQRTIVRRVAKRREVDNAKSH